MDPYVYPDTTVLKNLRGLRDQSLLNAFEMDMTTRRLSELAQRPIRGMFDIVHIESIHNHIFRDVYEWAGKFRTVNIARSGQFYFCFPQQIVPSLGTLLGELNREHNLAGSGREEFCNRAAYFMGELNAIHPFRDGNGRTQREFIRQLLRACGFSIEWSRVTREQMYEASNASFKSADHGGLAQVLLRAMA